MYLNMNSKSSKWPKLIGLVFFLTLSSGFLYSQTSPTVTLTDTDADNLLSASDTVTITATFSEAMVATPTITISNSQSTPVNQRVMNSAGFGFGGSTIYDETNNTNTSGFWVTSAYNDRLTENLSFVSSSGNKLFYYDRSSANDFGIGGSGNIIGSVWILDKESGSYSLTTSLTSGGLWEDHDFGSTIFLSKDEETLVIRDDHGEIYIYDIDSSTNSVTLTQTINSQNYDSGIETTQGFAFTNMGMSDDKRIIVFLHNLGNSTRMYYSLRLIDGTYSNPTRITTGWDNDS